MVNLISVGSIHQRNAKIVAVVYQLSGKSLGDLRRVGQQLEQLLNSLLGEVGRVGSRRPL